MELIGVETDELVDAAEDLDLFWTDVAICCRDGQDEPSSQIAMRRCERPKPRLHSSQFRGLHQEPLQMSAKAAAIDGLELQRVLQMALKVSFLIRRHRAIGDTHRGTELQEDGSRPR